MENRDASLSTTEGTLRRHAPEFLGSDVIPLESLAATHSSAGGTLRWQAPELLRTDVDVENTLASDIYAYGSVCYEVRELSCEVPLTGS
jgi:hypothetical protein